MLTRPFIIAHSVITYVCAQRDLKTRWGRKEGEEEEKAQRFPFFIPLFQYFLLITRHEYPFLKRECISAHTKKESTEEEKRMREVFSHPFNDFLSEHDQLLLLQQLSTFLPSSKCRIQSWCSFSRGVIDRWIGILRGKKWSKEYIVAERQNDFFLFPFSLFFWLRKFLLHFRVADAHVRVSFLTCWLVFLKIFELWILLRLWSLFIIFMYSSSHSSPHFTLYPDSRSSFMLNEKEKKLFFIWTWYIHIFHFS